MRIPDATDATVTCGNPDCRADFDIEDVRALLTEESVGTSAYVVLACPTCCESHECTISEPSPRQRWNGLTEHEQLLRSPVANFCADVED